MQFSEEQIRKAVAAKSAEELLEMAKAEGLSLTEEEAEHYFKVLHADPADAECMELSEEEQENVAGGTCYSGGVTDHVCKINRQYAIVSPLNTCPYYERFCYDCGNYFVVEGTWYCNQRWKGHDTLNNGRSDEISAWIDD